MAEHLIQNLAQVLQRDIMVIRWFRSFAFRSRPLRVFCGEIAKPKRARSMKALIFAESDEEKQVAARLYQLTLSIRLTFYRLLRFTSALLESRMHHFRRRREGTEFEERHSFEVRRPRPSRTGSGRPQWRRRSAVMADRQRLKSQTFVAKTIPYCVCHAVRTTTSSENYPTLFAPRRAYPSGARRELA